MRTAHAARITQLRRNIARRDLESLVSLSTSAPSTSASSIFAESAPPSSSPPPNPPTAGPPMALTPCVSPPLTHGPRLRGGRGPKWWGVLAGWGADAPNVVAGMVVKAASYAVESAALGLSVSDLALQ